jgi:hypothetical protein
MSKHTPGPWYEDAGYICTKSDEGDFIILAEMHSTFGPDDYGVDQWRLEDDELDANARLIAAAPEMYELIQALATSTESGYASPMSEAALLDTLHQLQGQAKQLLTQIKGGKK